MNTPSDKSITASEQPNEASELTGQELDAATGGSGTAALANKVASGIKAMDEAPKETVTFEYGGLVIRYGQQKADGA